MKIKDMKQAVNLLDLEWNLGKRQSKTNGKICAWIYLMGILEESESIIIEKRDGKLIGFGGYAKWNSKKNMISKKVYNLIRKILFYSPSIKDKKALKKYHEIYDYTPAELQNYFDGEISILIVDSKYRGQGIGKEILLKTFALARKDNMKNLQILTDESCNYEFYQNCKCNKVYETIIHNGESRDRSDSQEKGYIFEKVLK